jgi:hypothetical protein
MAISYGDIKKCLKFNKNIKKENIQLSSSPKEIAIGSRGLSNLKKEDWIERKLLKYPNAR